MRNPFATAAPDSLRFGMHKHDCTFRRCSLKRPGRLGRPGGLSDFSLARNTLPSSPFVSELRFVTSQNDSDQREKHSDDSDSSRDGLSLPRG